MRNKWLFFIFLFSNACILFLCSLSAFAGTDFKKDQPIEVTADSLIYDKSKDTYYAEGNVIAVQEKSSIRADKMTVDMSASHATAIGNVQVVDEGGNTLKGDRLELDIDSKVGVVVNGRLFFKRENVHVEGEEIKKTGDESYTVRNGFFTTCDCEEGESPAWGFYSSDADVTFGQYLHAWNTVFYVKKVPAFYFPYVVFPVKRERETGFLTPRVGYSELRGFKLDNSFFWAISDNTDATFYLDIEERRGIGKGIEYRYALSRSTEGEFYFYHFDESDINRIRRFRSGSDNLSRPKTATNDRWFLQYKHTQLLPYDIILKADIKRVSDDEYFIDFGKDIKERSLESLESNVALTKTWSKFNLVAQFRYFDNLLIADDKATLQRLPEVALTGSDKQIMASPFYFSLDSSSVNFDRKEGVTGQRVDVHPTVSLPLNPGRYFEFKPSAGFRETFYWLNNQPKDNYYDRSLYDLNADITTTFVRISSLGVNETEEGLKKLKHTIRPKITYIYMPEVVQNDLPSFDGVDRIAARNEFAYSLNSVLTGKFMEEAKPSYRDYIYMDLSQSYNINEETRKLTSPADKRRPFSDITGEVRLKPLSWALITAKGRYSPYDDWMNEYNASLGLWDKRGDSLDISYRYIRSSLSTEYLDSSLRFKLIQSVDLTYRNRYSYSDKRAIEAAYGLEYHQQCWGAQLTYTERLEEKIVMVTFNLLGIGEVGGAGGKME
ncbi:MAG: LPS-assembly protein LptD [Deltaproteobacteria bacterium]|nr:LPS-assembly protein LptD [Deltaproteobacteria bacterium]MBI3755303.1 LPS-assembly protein LptD [Deltaproteobacteria bacterium]